MNPRLSGLMLALSSLLITGCVPSVHYVTPREWSSPSRRDSIVSSYRPSLEGRVVFLDPGHGGEDRVNHGPGGDAIEADVNLRVGLALRDYLAAAGARVIMSREKDTSIALADRPLMAVRSGAEIFISLHHNATGSADPITNYASVYYHSRPGRRDYHPANQDLARHIERDMSYAMRNPAPPYSPTFDGTLSDFDIYPNSGFAVLRGNPLPAVLIEGSFFTHPPEEQRLAIPEFNRIEAWGIFLGLGKYFKTGFPQLTLLSDTVVTVPRPVVAVGISPWQDVDPKSVEVLLNNAPVPWTWNDSSRTILLFPAQDLRSGGVDLDVVAQSREGKWAWPFRKHITVMLPAASVFASLHPDTLPAVAGAEARLVCWARDINGDPVADGCPIQILSPFSAIDTTLRTSGGRAVCYLAAPRAEGGVPLEVRCQKTDTSLVLTSLNDGSLYVGGTVSAADSGSPLGRACVSVPTGGRLLSDTTWADGKFMIRGAPSSPETLLTARDGYFPSRTPLSNLLQTGVEIPLLPVAARKLFDRTYLIDPRYGGTESGDRNSTGFRSADVNLEIAWRLAELLNAAGANAHCVRSTDTTITEVERARLSAESPRGMYIRIDAAEPTISAGAEIYENIPNRRLAERMLAALSAVARIETSAVKPSHERFYRDVAMGTISIRLPSVSTGYYDSSAAQAIDRIAWCLFGGILNDAGFVDHAPAVLRYPAGTPSVSLGGLFRQIPDRRGEVCFFGLDSPNLVPSPPPALRTPLWHNP